MNGIEAVQSTSQEVPLAGSFPLAKYSLTIFVVQSLADVNIAVCPYDSYTTTADPLCWRDNANSFASGLTRSALTLSSRTAR